MSHARNGVAAIPRSSRLGLGAVGVASWITGGVATFVAPNGAGAAALVTVGVGAGVLALIGRWPSRLTFSGNEIVFEEVDRAVSDSIEAVEDSGEDSIAQELRLLRHRINMLQVTGFTPVHPAEQYDRQILEAIKALLPGASVHRGAVRGHDLADFVVRHDSRELLVETKWRADPDRPFGGSTLSRLAEALDGDAHLLVVANSRDITRANEKLARLMPGRAAIVSWSSPADNDVLRNSIHSLLQD